MTIAATGTQRSRPFLPLPGFICWHVAEYYTSPKEGGREGGTGGRNRGGGLCAASIVSTPTYICIPPSFYEYESIGESIVLFSGRSERFLGFGW